MVTKLRIASSSVTEKHELWASRCGTRRERPQKLKIGPEKGKVRATGVNLNSFETDIESFVSGCIPASFVAGGANGKDDQHGDDAFPQRRSKLIRKRTLPLLSFLSSTHVAAAEKRRKKEEQDRQNSMAEKEAKNALLLNPINPAVGSESLKDKTSDPGMESREMVGCLDKELNITHHAELTAGENGHQLQEAPTVTIRIEKTSNILTPPFLKDFLNQLENCPK